MNAAMRLHWDAAEGWVVDVPAALSRPMLDRLVAWALPRQRDRWRSLPTGDKRDELGRAIGLLEQGGVRQRIVGERGNGKGDIVIYGGH